MQTNDFGRAMELFFRDSIRRLATIKPAIVQAVEGNRVRVKPLTKTLYKDGTQIECPELFDVPLMIYSAKKGSARITVPVSRGDLVVVLFSDRDYGNLLNENITAANPQDGDDLWCMGLYPIMALPCFFTLPQEKDISSDNIVIENGSTSITVAPSGEVSVKASKATFDCVVEAEDFVAGGVSLIEHTHKYTDTGSPVNPLDTLPPTPTG